MTKQNWFEVDKEGLKKLLADKGKIFIVYELLQNAWDELPSSVDLYLTYNGRKRGASIRVIDDHPEGFKFLHHAYTLFAESTKKDNPRKRGRWNLGEKLILACCKYAKIKTTKGTVEFTENGKRKVTKDSTSMGSVFEAFIPMTKIEYEEMQKGIDMLIPPRKIVTNFHNIAMKSPVPITTFKVKLPTVISDKEGNLKNTIRKTTVEIYKPSKGNGWIYEMGIPVVKTGDKFHINVMQKVPLNMYRDNVTPSYLRTVRTEVLNNTIDLVTEDEISDTWVKEALSDVNCTDYAIGEVLTKRYGEKRVIFDPSDPEANKIAVSQGYTLIPGRSLSKNEWFNIKRTGAAKPAGQVTPSNKINTSPDGNPPIPRDRLTDAMKRVVEFTEVFGDALMDIEVTVQVTKSIQGARAWYGGKTVTFNYTRLGKKFFTDFPNNMIDVIDLCIHEFGHEYSGDHLSEEYYRALTRLGAKATMLAINAPEFFKKRLRKALSV